jgi:hypothetical protein
MKKSQVAVAVESTLDNVSIAVAIGALLGQLNELENTAEKFKADINNHIATLFTRKVTVGRYKKDGTGCAIATAFIDGCVGANVSPATAQRVYLGTFKDAVATGKPVSDWNKARADKKGKGGKGKGKAAFADLFLKSFNHDEGKSFQALAQEIEIRFLNDEGSVYDLFVSFLQKEGFEIKE